MQIFQSINAAEAVADNQYFNGLGHDFIVSEKLLEYKYDSFH